MNASVASRTLRTLAAWVVVGLFFFPIYYWTSVAFKYGNDIFSRPPNLFHFTPTFDNFQKVFGISLGRGGVTVTPGGGNFFMAPRLWDSIVVATLSTLVAIVIAVPLGLAIAFSTFLRRTIYPFFVSLEMTPKIAFAPLFISWLGFGLLPKVIIVFLVCFFPVVLNAILAFGSLSEELVRFIRATGATPLRAFFKVRLPAALPQCFVGFKYAAINATVGATIAEFIGSDQGLGFYIQIVTGNMRPDLAFAGIFLLTLLGLALFGAVTLVERWVIPWHISQRRSH